MEQPHIAPKIGDRLFMRVLHPLLPVWVRPNHLTAARFVLGTLTAIALVAELYALGIVLFTLAALTDWADGALARVRRQTSVWGMLYEPIADKLLIMATLAVLASQQVSVVLGVILCVVEAIAAIGIWLWHRKGKIEGANVWGKYKMIFETSGTGLLILGKYFASALLMTTGTATLAVALVLALISVYHKVR